MLFVVFIIIVIVESKMMRFEIDNIFVYLNLKFILIDKNKGKRDF